MQLSTMPTTQALEALATDFFRQSEGQWQSQRRYYTLKNDDTQEVVSDIEIHFLEAGHPALVELAGRHELPADQPLLCGVELTWESNYVSPSRKQSTGSTKFGIRGNILYRDRGFATPKPVIATYQFRDEQTMRLHTEYGGSSFDEELKFIGANYRTRQTIISRAGEEIMVGQYLEKRVG
ncbi:MAG: phycobiliprotein lyase [Leptolyngbya sp. SIO4C1]|nr:phycobiliprotein lyase [Leptolyngbya sp. SIO4C1]